VTILAPSTALIVSIPALSIMKVPPEIENCKCYRLVTKPNRDNVCRGGLCTLNKRNIQYFSKLRKNFACCDPLFFCSWLPTCYIEMMISRLCIREGIFNHTFIIFQHHRQVKIQLIHFQRGNPTGSMYGSER